MLQYVSKFSRRLFGAGLPAFATIGCRRNPISNLTGERTPSQLVGVVGSLFMPSGEVTKPAVICLTGAEGGLWEAPAIALANEGFPALALAVSNFSGTPDTIKNIEVENVERAVNWLRNRAKPLNDFVAVRGWSRGGELSLILASLTSSVNAAITYAPRCYVALENGKQNAYGDRRASSAWLYKGQPVLGSPLDKTTYLDRARPSFEDIHGIAVENIRGPVLFVSGGSDTGLDGTTAEYGCNYAMRRLKLKNFGYRYEHLSYPNAGHNIAGPPSFKVAPFGGGSIEGDAYAVADSWPRSLAFLEASAKN